MAEIDVKIVSALDRVSQAVRVLLRNKSQSNALSPIQTQILIFLLLQPGGSSRITALAGEFDLTKATVSDSIKSLLHKCLVHKSPDPADERSCTILLTDRGKEMALKSAGFISELEKSLDSLNALQKEAIYTGLLQTIFGLHTAGVISVQKMCLTCIHYESILGGHSCRLLESNLTYEMLRLNCTEHSKATNQ
ncbi:MarR family winged helix-turn-helix transcriptional regulator [Dyadobacter sandarakinus]|uniref:Winged helix-turn-helix transcriptional regulator n=1 Tax=Dyadobacter sandarakinus TaxID=2747268 RepID=A0ABX7I1U0_9BACT|nr:MarR family winged helix-turn-helix transcriptional regulator [Dyadobacter sandarakinus]QRR00047.1 winged helix-turn-helix transcriptional regulator [Dyadobacter sandarakinus]